MSAAKTATRGLVADNGYAAINVTADSVQVIGWYTPPWVAILLAPLVPIASVAALWIMFRTIFPPAARSLAPRIDGPLEAFVQLFQSPIHGWLGRNDWNFGYELTLSLMFGSIAAIFSLVIAAKLLVDQGWGMRFLSYTLRFPLRVEIWKDRIRIGRRPYQRTGREAFSVDAPSAVKNNRPRNVAYDQSLSITFETAIARQQVVDVFGIERAEGIVLILNGALSVAATL